MAKVGATRAAELCGKSKSTIQRAMKSGKLSFERDMNNRRVIDVSEIERVFGLVKSVDSLDENDTSNNGKSSAKNDNTAEKEAQPSPDVEMLIEMERMKMRIKTLEYHLEDAREQLEDLRQQRDQWQRQAQQVLITSQYSQKQAEDLREQMRLREERARQRRQKILEARMKNMQAENQNKIFSEKKKCGFMGLFRKKEQTANKISA